MTNDTENDQNETQCRREEAHLVSSLLDAAALDLPPLMVTNSNTIRLGTKEAGRKGRNKKGRTCHFRVRVWEGDAERGRILGRAKSKL